MSYDTLPDPTDLDAARRIADEVDYHLTAGRAAAIDMTNRWIAARLADGVCAHEAYDSKDEAMRFAPKVLGVTHPNLCLYVQIPLTGMPVREAYDLLRLMRQPWLRTDAPVESVNPYAHRPLTLPRGHEGGLILP